MFSEFLCEIHLLFCWCLLILSLEQKNPSHWFLCVHNIVKWMAMGYPPGEDFHSTRSSSPRINPTPWLSVTSENHNSHTFTVKQCFTHTHRETEQGEFREGTLVPQRASRSPPTSGTRWWSAGTASCVLGEGACFFPSLHTRDRMQSVVGRPLYTHAQTDKMKHVLSLNRKMFPRRLEGSYILVGRRCSRPKAHFYVLWGVKKLHTFLPFLANFIFWHHKIDWVILMLPAPGMESDVLQRCPVFRFVCFLRDGYLGCLFNNIILKGKVNFLIYPTQHSITSFYFVLLSFFSYAEYPGLHSNYFQSNKIL